MKPKIFKIGDQVTRVDKHMIKTEINEFVPGPKFGEVYEVQQHCNPNDFGYHEATGYWFVTLKGYEPYAIREDRLALVLPTSIITSLLEETQLTEHA